MKIRRLNRGAPKETVSRYKAEPAFRETQKAHSRENYRKKAENFEIVSPARSLDYYTTLAEQMPVSYNGHTFNKPCIKVTQLADLLQISYQSLWRSHAAETIPAPVLLAHMGKRELAVYSVDEVRAILTIIAEHKRKFSYYRKDHHDTRRKLFEAVATIRNQWETPCVNPPDPPRKRQKPLLLKRKKP